MLWQKKQNLKSSDIFALVNGNLGHEPKPQTAQQQKTAQQNKKMGFQTSKQQLKGLYGQNKDSEFLKSGVASAPQLNKIGAEQGAMRTKLPFVDLKADHIQTQKAYSQIKNDFQKNLKFQVDREVKIQKENEEDLEPNKHSIPDLVPGKNEGTDAEWRVYYREKEEENLKRMSQTLQQSQRLLGRIEGTPTEREKFMKISEDFDSIPFERLLHILNENFKAITYKDVKEVIFLLRTLNNYPNILGEKMDQTEVRNKLRDKISELDTEDLEIYNAFLDICAEIDSFPPKREEELNFWLESIEKHELKQAEHRAILAMHNQRVFGISQDKHSRMRTLQSVRQTWQQEFLFKPKKDRYVSTGM